MFHLTAHRCPDSFMASRTARLLVSTLSMTTLVWGFLSLSCILASPILHRLPGQSYR